MIRLRLALVAAIVCVPALSAAAPQSSHPNIYAESYNVRLDVQPDGSLDVTETIALTVGAKSMSWFERVVPSRGTDGITNVVALMDGQSAPVTIEHGGDLKVRWEFGPTANTTHTFEIHYRALHVLSREIDGPRLDWTALPRRHTYPIDSASISLFAPAGSAAARLSATGGEVAPTEPGRDGIVIVGRDIGRDRTIRVDLTFAPNSIRPVEAQWAILEQRQRDMLPAWLAGAATLFVVGIGILVMLFAQLPRPTVATEEQAFVTPAAAGSVPPALVALLLSRGRTDGWLPMQAAFFRLVRDGQLTMTKRAGGRMRSAFDVSIGAPGATAPHEQWIVDEVRAAGSPTDFRKLMQRWSRKKGEFLKRLRAEATTNGWLHAERVKSRGGLMATGFVLMIVALVTALAIALLAPRLGPAPLSLAGVTFAVGIIYIVVSNAMSLLAEPGLREAASWDARVAELKDIVKHGVSGHSTRDFERWFPIAIAAGFGGKWLKAFASQLTEAGAELAWLKALGSPADAAASLAVIVAASTATHGGGAGGAGGAGGGSSGAG
jgi:hypothetical protein